MIDYCITAVHEREQELLLIHLNSLRHYNGDLFNVKVSVRPEDSDAIEFCNRLGLEVLIHPTYIQTLSPGWNLRQAGFDNAYRLDGLMKSCTSDWAIIAHSDIVYHKNMMERIPSFLNDEFGLLGVYAHGSAIINRKIYNHCHYGFWPMGGILARKVEGENAVSLVGNLEQESEFLSVSGVDVGELLKMEMQGYGYKFDSAGSSEFYYHMGGGGFSSVSDFDQEVVDTIDIRTKAWINKFKRWLK